MKRLFCLYCKEMTWHRWDFTKYQWLCIICGKEHILRIWQKGELNDKTKARATD